MAEDESWHFVNQMRRPLVARCGGPHLQGMGGLQSAEGQQVLECAEGQLHESEADAGSERQMTPMTSSQSSASTADPDEEVLYHFKRMQLYHAKRLTRLFHGEGYKTMEQIVSADLEGLAEKLQIGSGDVSKLRQGLARYQDGTFDAMYSLPLADVVQAPEAPTCVDIGAQEQPTCRDAAVQVMQAPQRQQEASPVRATSSAQAARGTQATQGLTFENIIVSFACSGLPICAIFTIIMRLRHQGRKPGDPRKFGRPFDLMAFKGGMTALWSAPVLAAIHMRYGLNTPARSVGLSIGGGVATFAASCVGCDLTTGGCFDSSAQVMLANRSQKAIDTLQEGVRILSFNRGIFRVKRVLRIIRGDRLAAMWRIHFRLPDESCGSLVTTPGHPLWVHGKGWCAMPGGGCDLEASSSYEVKVNDILVHHTGAAVQVTAIEICRSQSAPFNLVVDGPGTFFVNGLLVHSHMDQSRQPPKSSRVAAIHAGGTAVMAY